LTMTDTVAISPAPRAEAAAKPLLSVNEMRLTGRQWLATILIVTAFACGFPTVWKHLEPFPTGPDYRIPYALSRDYWLYERRLDQLPATTIPLVGDSVVWGEYVRPDGSLSHFLNQRSGNPTAFANCGVNGMFPLALEGLLKDYGRAISHRKVILQCNLLWLSSPKADLRAPGDGNVNHSRLLPQFDFDIPGYKADLSERLSAIFERHVPLLAWSQHIDTAYFGDKSIPQWTLEENDADPPGLPNAWKNPLDNLRHGIPGEPAVDRQRGPKSYRHRPWNSDGAEPMDFDWVSPDRSLQFATFLRVVRLLRSRGNDVLVILGPFNEHMIAGNPHAESGFGHQRQDAVSSDDLGTVDHDQWMRYESIRTEAAQSLNGEGVPVVIPATLFSNFYADASHPLTEGYVQLAGEIFGTPAFQQWLAK
jgi:hypothetical protein